MNAITLETKDNKYLVTIEKTAIDRETLQQLIDQFRMEHLAGKVNFDDSVLELGKEIKENWWKENRDRLLKENK